LPFITFVNQILSVDLAPYIRELILNHECIILPDFGGFETTYSPAQFNEELGQMLPPTKKIEFKPEYKVGGDALLAQLSSKLQISEDDAEKRIGDYVSDLKLRLRNQEYVLLEGIGIFRPDFSGNPVFESFDNENYLVDSFGLEPLSISNTEAFKTPGKSKIQIQGIASRNSTLTFVIFGIVIIGILMAITIILSAKFDLFLFNIGTSKQSSDYIILGGSNDKNVKKIEEHINNSTSLKRALSYKPNHSDTTANNQINYLLVVGSFKKYRYAQDLNYKLNKEGFSVEIIETDGSYRVCVGKYEDKSVAEQELERIRRQLNQSVWMFKSTIP
jgi:nucleoid DNA-binding protein